MWGWDNIYGDVAEGFDTRQEAVDNLAEAARADGVVRQAIKDGHVRLCIFRDADPAKFMVNISWMKDLIVDNIESSIDQRRDEFAIEIDDMQAASDALKEWARKYVRTPFQVFASGLYLTDDELAQVLK